MKCKKIVVSAICLFFLVGVAFAGTGMCQQTKGNETTTTAPAPQGTPAPGTAAAPAGDKAKAQDSKKDDKKAPAKKSYEGC
jgi:hypothetical protein